MIRRLFFVVVVVAVVSAGAEVRATQAASTSTATLPSVLIFTGHLYGSQVVGGSNSIATGTATVVIDQATETMTTDAQWSGLSGPADRVHVHSGAVGQSRDDYLFRDVGGDDTSPYRTVPCPYVAAYVNCLPASGSLHDVADLSQGSYNCLTFQCIVDHAVPAGLFIDMHTFLYGSGEIRGQLVLVTNWVANNSFEKPAGGGPFVAGDAMDGWTVDSGDVDMVGASYGLWPGFSGAQSIDLNGTQPGAISQTITTIPGVAYKISFALAGNPDCGPTTKKLTVSWNGVPLGVKKFDTTGHTYTAMGWVQRSFTTTTATTTSANLTFTSSTTGACGAVIDAIKVVPL